MTTTQVCVIVKMDPKNWFPPETNFRINKDPLELILLQTRKNYDHLSEINDVDHWNIFHFQNLVMCLKAT